MHILLIGGGGREHAMAWKLHQSPLCTALHCAPGNAGIADIATCHAVAADNIAGLVALAQKLAVDFVVVAPDTPLVLGLVDALQAAGIPAFGPSCAAAQIEGSKEFMKILAAENNIPTAAYQSFQSAAEAIAYLDVLSPPYVIKADGLALGKGVVIAADKDEAIETIHNMLGGQFGASSQTIIIEEFMRGEEVSFFGLSDGTHILPLMAAQDHKQAYDGDKGPNTGGMGAYSPVPMFDAELQQQVMDNIMQPTIDGMKKRGTPFVGFLYAGLMIVETPAGKIAKLIEFNCRGGDPETQVMMPRLKNDLVPLLWAATNGTLNTHTIETDDQTALTIVYASNGYPGDYEKNTIITGVDACAEIPHIHVFHAGTARNAAGDWVNAGGRVLNITAMGPDVKTAQHRAYDAIKTIDWPQGFYRRDIGWRAV